MSMATLEREIVAEARRFLNNRKLRNKDLLAWSTGVLEAEDESELAVQLDSPGLRVWIVVSKSCDKRGEGKHD